MSMATSAPLGTLKPLSKVMESVAYDDASIATESNAVIVFFFMMSLF